MITGGCAQPEVRPRFTELSYGHLAPLMIRAGRVDVMESYEAPMRAPNVDHEMPLSPARAARQWAFDRIQATGETPYTVLMTIHDAAVTEKTLGVQKGLEGAFKSEQAERYDANLEATVELVDPDSRVTLAQASAKVWRFITLPEEASVNDREAAWFTLVEQLMDDFNTRMEKSIHTYMGAYLV
ncbi:MAG: hypothetical protein K9H25_07355 [Rhodospirillum sp.]|nr:hypothetical protein [Rhodospirillum sp.]MCF8488765.1 hypothetical protein [Rhodospirillum sp.]MCF8499717.1 hypothetical protein [Rhodospirillum sp.]